MTHTISEIKKRYKNEWLLVNVVEENKLNQPVKGSLITHSKNKDDIYEKMKKLPKGFRVATIFTGKVPPKGTVFAFLVDCLIRDLPTGSGVNGLLGLSFLKHFNINLNFQKGFLELKSY